MTLPAPISSRSNLPRCQCGRHGWGVHPDGDWVCRPCLDEERRGHAERVVETLGFDDLVWTTERLTTTAANAAEMRTG